MMKTANATPSPSASVEPRVDLPKGAALKHQIVPVIRLGWRRVRRQKCPFQMSLSLTNRCNFRCDYCHIPLQNRAELSTEEWYRVIDELHEGGMGRASLIGGEPLLRKDAGAIIHYLKSKGLHVAMNTNGWWTEERIADVSKLDLVCLTLDGPQAIHDKQRRKGSYERVIRSIELLKRHGVNVVTMTVVTPKGAENIEHVLKIAKEYGFLSFFQLEHDANCDVYLPIAPKLSDLRVTQVAERLIQLKDQGWPVGNSYAILDMQKRDGRRLGGDCSHCYAGQYYGYVFSDGTIAPCLFTQWQQEQQNGKKHGYLRAFHDMKAPEGPGCGCVPIHEVNRVLDFDLRVLWNAVDLALRPVGQPTRVF
jgi:MoaA/NifB/PqqE/SkfB family radical SAM enzyme